MELSRIFEMIGDNNNDSITLLKNHDLVLVKRVKYDFQINGFLNYHKHTALVLLYLRGVT